MSDRYADDTPQFEEVPYQGNRGGMPEQEPYVGFHGNYANLLKKSYELMGEPDALRCYLNGLKLGLEPIDPGQQHAYPVNDHEDTCPSISVGWIKYELDLDGELRGRARLRFDEDAELWVVNVDEVLGQPKQSAEVTVDNVLAAMRLAGDWLEDQELHEPAADVGRAYNHVKERRDELRKREKQVAEL